MSKHLKFLLCAAVTVAFAIPTFADEAPNAESVMATVNGRSITLGEMIMVRATLPEQYNQVPNEDLFTGILDQLVQQTVLEQSFKGKVPDRVEVALRNQRRQMIASEVIQSVLDGAVTDEAINAAYSAKYTDFKGETEFDASHILVATKEDAEAIIAELKGGADFIDTAKTKSTGPTGPSGGALGWFGPGQMVKPFEDAVAGMTVNGISDPVQTQFGWHIIKLNATRIQEAPSLETVRAEIIQGIKEMIVDNEVTKLTAEAKIDRSASQSVDPALLGQTSLLEN